MFFTRRFDVSESFIVLNDCSLLICQSIIQDLLNDKQSLNIRVSRKQRFSSQQLYKQTSDRPNINRFPIFSISNKEFWSSIPTSRYIICIVLLIVQWSSKSKIAHLQNAIFWNEQIFRFDVSMNNVMRMYKGYSSY